MQALNGVDDALSILLPSPFHIPTTPVQNDKDKKDDKDDKDKTVSFFSLCFEYCVVELTVVITTFGITNLLPLLQSFSRLVGWLFGLFQKLLPHFSVTVMRCPHATPGTLPHTPTTLTLCQVHCPSMRAVWKQAGPAPHSTMVTNGAGRDTRPPVSTTYTPAHSWQVHQQTPHLTPPVSRFSWT